jgi:hypothetical protein
MSKFVVNRAEGASLYIEEPGNYNVAISIKEFNLTPNGDVCAVLRLTADDGRAITDRIINKSSVFWRIQQLIAAAQLPIEDGVEFDFSKSDNFRSFMAAFEGRGCAIAVVRETYQSNGEQKSGLKVRRYFAEIETETAF